ncbi:transketolase [Enemella sp. A6]|uniref:transketolase n=1 Tax=Enemella sp. A6 TaxID=3440152 RepID=UPI003EBD9106
MTTDLKLLADEIRYWTLRELLNLGYGHFGGSLSIVEALAVLYGDAMTYDPANPDSEDRDWFILSKGHAGPAWYATLALRGFFDTDRLMTLNANGTDLPSHPDRLKVPGVEMTTGSMGQGISAASGVAYRLLTTGKPNRVYCIVGDGELNEGQPWEAAQFIAHQNLHNLTVLVDDNKRQLDGFTEDISRTFDFVEKFNAFGFHAVRVDGQSVDEIKAAIDQAKGRTDRPTCIVLDTTKGAGVPCVAETKDNHHMRLDDEATAAIRATMEELGARVGVQA